MSENRVAWVMKNEAIAARLEEARRLGCCVDDFHLVGDGGRCACGKRFSDEAGRPRDLSLRDVMAKLEEMGDRLRAIELDVVRLLERK